MTLQPTRSPAPSGPVREERRRPAPPVRVVCVLVVVVVVGQRFALPAGPQALPLSLVVGYAGCAALLWWRAVRFDRLRLELFALAGTACAAATYLGLWWDDDSLSLPSLVLLLLIYALWCLRLTDTGPGVQRAVLGTFVRTMLVLSALGVLQMTAQYAGVWQYQDYLGAVVPPDLLLQAYNTDAPTSYLSPIYRGNAFVFLEPSFLSQYCALAVLVALLLRAPAWQLGLLTAGLASAVSGTGFLLLSAGLVAVVLRDRSALRPSYLVTGVLALAALLASPVASGLLDRASEFGESGSSASLRLVQPYTETARGLQEGPSRPYVGAGPGSAERLLSTDRDGGLGRAVTYTTAPKLVFEYGLVAGGLFMLFLLVCLFGGRSVPAVPFALFLMTWVLSGALLQPHTAVLAWLLAMVCVPGRVGLGRRPGPRAVQPSG